MERKKIKDRQTEKLYLGKDSVLGSFKNGTAGNVFGSGEFGLFLARGPTDYCQAF